VHALFNEWELGGPAGDWYDLQPVEGACTDGGADWWYVSLNFFSPFLFSFFLSFFSGVAELRGILGNFCKATWTPLDFIPL
jgi:hypothetical protein